MSSGCWILTSMSVQAEAWNALSVQRSLTGMRLPTHQSSQVSHLVAMLQAAPSPVLLIVAYTWMQIDPALTSKQTSCTII